MNTHRPSGGVSYGAAVIGERRFPAGIDCGESIVAVRRRVYILLWKRGRKSSAESAMGYAVKVLNSNSLQWRGMRM